MSFKRWVLVLLGVAIRGTGLRLFRDDGYVAGGPLSPLAPVGRT